LITRVSIPDLNNQNPITGTAEESLLVYNTIPQQVKDSIGQGPNGKNLSFCSCKCWLLNFETGLAMVIQELQQVGGKQLCRDIVNTDFSDY
jgi:hypothetical protein